MDEPVCPSCDLPDFVGIGRVVCQSGAEHHTWYCFLCNTRITNAGRPWLGGTDVARIIGTGEPAPIVADYREHPCAVCGDLGTEVHHWAPHSLSDLFGDDWARWPTAYLCRKHHAMWHDIVTPAMPGRHDPSLAGEALRRWEK